MKKIKKIILNSVSFGLAVLNLIGAAACSKSRQANGNSYVKEENVSETETTDESFIGSGKSDYVIVISDSCTALERFASVELQGFIYEATSCKLPILSDSTKEANYSESARVISLGDTVALRQTKIENTISSMSAAEYKIVTENKSTFIFGKEHGVLSGVYRFLKEYFNFEVFASDEIYFDIVASVDFMKMNIRYEPSFDVCISSSDSVATDNIYANRLRTIPWKQFWMPVYGYSFATTFALLPKSTYYSKHPDWYNTNGDDLCYSNFEAADELIERLKREISANRDTDYVMVGQEDNCSWCNCPKCRETIAKYGAESATLVQYINYVSGAIDEWLSATDPGRKVKIGFFAYQHSLSAPVNSENGKYVPADETMILRDNVIAVVAPIGANFAYSFKDSENADSSMPIKQWATICKNVCVWTYGTNFINYFYPFDSYNNLKENLEYFFDNNVRIYFEQGQGGSGYKGGTQFLELKQYLISSLAYDLSQNVETLTDNFFKQYYKEAAPSVRKYYDDLRRLFLYQRDVLHVAATIYIDQAKPEYWPKGTVDYWAQCIEEGKQAIRYLSESSKKEDIEKYELLLNRLEVEELQIQYIYIELYEQYFTEAQLNEMKNKFKEVATRNGVGRLSEGSFMATVYKKWGVD